MTALTTLFSPGDFVELFIRDEDTCTADNSYDGEHFGARISAVFVVLIASAFGSFFPVLSSKYSFIRLPPTCFFVAKFFGSGVIIATAFIHLLQPANENLSDDCLGYPFDVYPLAFGIALIVLMVMFFLELIAYRWIEAKLSNQSLDSNEPHTHSHFGDTSMYVHNEAEQHNNGYIHTGPDEEEIDYDDDSRDESEEDGISNSGMPHSHSHHHHPLVHDKLEEITDNAVSNDKTLEKKDSYLEDAQDIEKQFTDSDSDSDSVYAAQILNVFVLEFGIVFHSVFVGLTLSCSGDEFVSLYIVVVFHQMFEGLGLGTRVACVDWPKSRRWTPWLLCLAYTFCTPIAIAIGIGVRNSYPPGSRRALITNGVFDSVSAGILIYTGCIELMAHEFLFSDEFKGPGGFKKMIWAYIVMCVGAGLMALLGRWA